MKISVSGQHMSVGQSLTEYINDRLNDVVTKYFDNVISAGVHFIKEGYRFTCDIIVNTSLKNHNVIKSNAICDDVYSSFDQSLSRMEKQLRKYKNRLASSRTNKLKVSENEIDKSTVYGATKYVIDTAKFYADANELVEEKVNFAPLTIAEKPIVVRSCSISDAIMTMDLENVPALMFRNVATGRMNIVYHRRDGNISWVDSDE